MISPFYYIDIYDIALAASLWELEYWDIIDNIDYYRYSESGIFITEVCVGGVSAKEFLQEFVFDGHICKFLARQNSLSWINNEFWDFLIGQRFTGKFWVRNDGEMLPNGKIYASLEGKIGELCLFEYGVTSIFDFCIPLATNGKRFIKECGTYKAKFFDATAIRSIGYGWSLLTTRAAIAAGFSPPKFVK